MEKGDIYGIVGFSGAGKSTLIRLVNKLETPDSGTITVDGCPLAGMRGKALHSLRRRIGMVFQQFNLLEGKTVYHNIAIPLLLEHRPKAEIDKRVEEEGSRSGGCRPGTGITGQMMGAGSAG